MREFSRIGVEVVIVAAAFALATLALWYLWLGPVWEALNFPRLHHWIYGMVLVSAGFGLNWRTRYKKASYFLMVVGLIWFVDDFQDFVRIFLKTFHFW